jgi:hypothetical protein
MSQNSHNLHGAGFVRLRELLPDPTEFPQPSAVHRERRGTRGGREFSELLKKNAICITTQTAFRDKKVGLGVWGKGRKKRDSTQPTIVDIRCKSLVLARQLDDEPSLPFYRLVVRKVPEQVIRDALMRTLDVPKRDIRRSRAALFTSIIREHLPRRPPSNRKFNS